MGFTQVWIPPPNKAGTKVQFSLTLLYGTHHDLKVGRGYDAYDLVDFLPFAKLPY